MADSKVEPYWLKPGGVPPASNPHTASVPSHSDGACAFAPTLPTSPQPNVQPPPEIPMAQPYCPQQATYNNQPRTVNNMDGHPPHPAYAVHPVLTGNGANQQYAVQYLTTTEEYCGPVTCAIGWVLCFFTGWGWLAVFCPCDTRTVTYVNGSRVVN
jgi:hypothetical protein